MAATSPSNPKPSGDDSKAAGATPVPLTLEDRLNQFWQKNRMIVLGLCALVLLVILGKGVWERMERQKESDLEHEFQTATTPDQLRAFAAAHPGHELAGLAELENADQAYSAEKYADAAAGYEKAIATLKAGPLVARAQIGRAMSKAQSGRAADGEAELKQLLNDTNQFKTIRAEAAYQLASLALSGGNVADVQKYLDQVNQIDPAGVWARRAVGLQASLPRPTAVGVPAVGATTPSSSKATQSGPSVQVKLPAK